MVKSRSRTPLNPHPILAAAAAAATIAPTPVFELHIRPMFRSLDREHMDFALNLWHYPDGPGADPIAHFTLILNRLKAPSADVVMPPPYAGGPWPQEWIDLFERWLAAGAPRLQLAQLDPSHLSASDVAGTTLVHLTAVVMLPTEGHVGWFERQFADGEPFSPERQDEFIIYQRAISTASPATTSVTLEDFLNLPSGISTVKLIGSNGTFSVAVT